MLQVTPNLAIPRTELTVSFIRASGPGGQNVNKVSSAVQLRFNLRTSPSLSEDIKSRLQKMVGRKLSADGELVIEAKRYRLQDQNRADAEQRLINLIRKALIQPKRRHPTHPTQASSKRRVEAKKRKGKIKSLRRSVNE